MSVYSKEYYQANRARYIASSAKWRQANPERYLELARVYRVRDRGKINARAYEHGRLRKEAAVQYKGGVCKDCGKMPHLAAMEFHHIDPATKEWPPAQIIKTDWELAKAELDKCDLLCANCHRIRHSRGS